MEKRRATDIKMFLYQDMVFQLFLTSIEYDTFALLDFRTKFMKSANDTIGLGKFTIDLVKLFEKFLRHFQGVILRHF